MRCLSASRRSGTMPAPAGSGTMSNESAATPMTAVLALGRRTTAPEGSQPGRAVRRVASDVGARRADLIEAVEDVVAEPHVHRWQLVGELLESARADDGRAHRRVTD